jgi:hypothetical protein
MDAMKRATYVGMTAEEARAFEARRTKLEALSKELTHLEQNESSS